MENVLIFHFQILVIAGSVLCMVPTRKSLSPMGLPAKWRGEFFRIMFAAGLILISVGMVVFISNLAKPVHIAPTSSIAQLIEVCDICIWALILYRVVQIYSRIVLKKEHLLERRMDGQYRIMGIIYPAAAINAILWWMSGVKLLACIIGVMIISSPLAFPTVRKKIKELF